MNDNILLLQNVCYDAPEQELLAISAKKKQILRNISFEVGRGKIAGISGQSGSGKTTLAKIIAGILTPSSGTVIINTKEDWKNIKTNPVQILFQNNGEILNPLRKIEDVIKEAITIRSMSNVNIDKEIEVIFKSVGFSPELKNRKGFELSGGEQQRAALARLLATRPLLLLLDEPFAAQDPESQKNLMGLFKQINRQFNITIICIAHDLKALRELTEDIIILYKGEIVEMDSTDKIFSSPAHPYTKFLLKAENYDLSYDELRFEEMMTKKGVRNFD